MAHFFTYTLFKMRLIQPSENAIMDWMYISAIDKLEYALKHGNYKTRQLAAEALEQVGQCSTIPVLLYAMNDKIQNVSIAALNALETLGSRCDDELIITITKKRFKWAEKLRDKEERQKHKKEKKYNIYKWERASKKSFELVKERLKRPIR